MLTFTVILFSIASLGMCHMFLQLARNNKVYQIRMKWIYSDDSRRYKYSYSEMMESNKHNWYGLKWPNEKDYK